MKALVLLLAIAGCAAPDRRPSAVDASFSFEDGVLDCPLADETCVYEPNLEFPKIALCYWSCATGPDGNGAVLYLLVDGALAPWLPEEPELQVFQASECAQP